MCMGVAPVGRSPELVTAGIGPPQGFRQVVANTTAEKIGLVVSDAIETAVDDGDDATTRAANDVYTIAFP